MKAIKLRAALISWGVFVASQGASGQASQLTGTVRDVCGRVIPGTAVTVLNQSGTATRTFARAEGRYSFGALAPGSWTITFETVGFQTQQRGISLPENGDALEYSVKLTPDLMLKEEATVSHSGHNVRYRKYSVHGILTGRSGEPVSRATIRFREVGSGASTGVTELCTTDELGRYFLKKWSPTATRWQLSVEAEGYRPYTLADFELTPDEPQAIDIRLEVR